ncbi:Efflux pump periplasmic linker BepF [Anatilimnocola aggregata]|uniref:Efflux pump periplasmic linker BepF n=2 Tax=Anatilimnocola aggregata TaxID=2528021 RepID=A0A517Y636_9BACT|nr:Efflux pump periplasmic linker BepF [Anatilimnocola aggregata]
MATSPPRLLVVLLSAALLGTLAASSGCRPAAPEAGEMPVPKVTTTAVVAQETLDSDDYTGQTEASEMVDIRARVFGYLKSIEFKDGDFVTGPVLGPNGEVEKEGQILFTVEPDEYEAIHNQSLARIDLNQANLTLAKAKLARNAALLKSSAVSREEYEESVAAVASTEATITAARADASRTAVDLKHTVIRAPISGRIDRAMVSKGSLLTGGQTNGTLLTKIVNENPMYVYFDVDERSLLRYMRMRAATRESAPGSLRDLDIRVYLQLADETDYKHEGTLDFISTTVNRTTGTARLRGVFKNEDRSLAGGLFVRLRIPVSKPYEALLIPEAALATDQSVKYVYVVGPDGTTRRQTVELGGTRGEMRIVTAGLKAGEHVIVKGLQRVKPGQKVDAELIAATSLH